MDASIGLQLYSVRNNLHDDTIGTLEKIAEIGYRNLELITTITPKGLLFGQDLSAEELHRQLDRLGLKAIGCHFIPNPDIHLETVLRDLQILEAGSLVCAAALFKNRAEVDDFNRLFNRYGEESKKKGIQLYYHNHFQEFQIFGDKSVYELMIEQLDPELVKFEFDTYWAVRAGQDPIYWMKKLATRCDLVHQKDLPEGVSPVNLFERLGYDAEISFASFASLNDIIKFTEIGEGTLNIPGIIQAARTYNQARYIIVEQDMSSRPEMESIALSYQNLSRYLEAGRN